MKNWDNKAKREYLAWVQEKESIQRAQPADFETFAERQNRIEKLLQNFDKFCKYYFEIGRAHV